MEPNEIIDALHSDHITPDEAADHFRAWLKEQPGYKEPKQFDQLERRLLFGIPIVEVDGNEKQAAER